VRHELARGTVSRKEEKVRTSRNENIFIRRTHTIARSKERILTSSEWYLDCYNCTMCFWLMMVFGLELFQPLSGVFEGLSPTWYVQQQAPSASKQHTYIINCIGYTFGPTRTNHAHSLLLDRQRHPVICFVDPPSIASLVHCIRWNQSKLVLIFSFFLQEEKNKNEKKSSPVKKYTASLW
jgi:hypothetical protein